MMGGVDFCDSPIFIEMSFQVNGANKKYGRVCVVNDDLTRAFITWDIKNEDFYSFCINEELIVNTLMLYRHMDNFIYDNESDIIQKLFVKEVLTSRSYLNYSKGVKKESIIPWDSEFNDQNFINGPDRICYFKVC